MNLESLIDKLVEKLTNTSVDVYATLLKQAYISATVNIISIIIWTFLLYIFFIYIKKNTTIRS